MSHGAAHDGRADLALPRPPRDECNRQPTITTWVRMVAGIVHGKSARTPRRKASADERAALLVFDERVAPRFHDQPHWRRVQIERIAQAIHQITLIALRHLVGA